MGGSSSKATVDEKWAKKEAEAREEATKKGLQYGWEDRNYGGIYKQKNNTLQRNETSRPDDMAIWRLEARSLRLMQVFDEANEALDMRPQYHKPRLPAELDLNKNVEQACHRSCIELWSAYARCLDKKKGKHDACTGWYTTYLNCFDHCTPKMVLTALEAMASHDPDPNMERLAR